MDVMMLIMLLLVVFVLLELFGIEKSLNRIAKSLDKTENKKNEEVKNDQQVD